MNNHELFKDTVLETDQPIEFESDQVEFKISRPSKDWKIAKINSSVVSSPFNNWCEYNIMLTIN